MSQFEPPPAVGQGAGKSWLMRSDQVEEQYPYFRPIGTFTQKGFARCQQCLKPVHASKEALDGHMKRYHYNVERRSKAQTNVPRYTHRGY